MAQSVRSELLRHPSLWTTALVVGWRLLPRGWWRRFPPELKPPPDYMAFRLQTMYGDASVPFAGEDLIAYLKWCRRVGVRRR